MINNIREFNEKFGILTPDKPTFLSDEDMKRRLDFQMEELLETAHAAGFEVDEEQEFHRKTGAVFGQGYKAPQEMAEILDGLVDQVYVALGTAAMMGFFGEVLKKAGIEDWENIDYYAPRFGHAWDRVHAANMLKQKVPGTWKVQKPEGWVRPNLEDLCE